MGEDYKYPPDTSWMSARTAKRWRNALGVVLLILIVLRIIDRIFLDNSLYNVVQVLWYELVGVRWT